MVSSYQNVIFLNTKAYELTGAEAIFYGYPSGIIILSFGYTNFRIEETRKQTLSKVATSKIRKSIKEDIFIFLLHKDFQLNAFKFNVGFLSVSEVSFLMILKQIIKASA